MAYMFISMTLTMLQGHIGSSKAKIKCRIISTTKQATASIKLATKVGQFVRDIDFANLYIAWPPC